MKLANTRNESAFAGEDSKEALSLKSNAREVYYFSQRVLSLTLSLSRTVLCHEHLLLAVLGAGCWAKAGEPGLPSMARLAGSSPRWHLVNRPLSTRAALAQAENTVGPGLVLGSSSNIRANMLHKGLRRGCEEGALGFPVGQKAATCPAGARPAGALS